MTDAGKVQQILYNLLSNAIKFTPEGGRITVQCRDADDLTVRISVTDTGCGIPAEHQDKIFEKFRQLDGSITRRAMGRGWGLPSASSLRNCWPGPSVWKASRARVRHSGWKFPVNLQQPAYSGCQFGFLVHSQGQVRA